MTMAKGSGALGVELLVHSLSLETSFTLQRLNQIPADCSEADFNCVFPPNIPGNCARHFLTCIWSL